ncbi:MAG: peptidase M75, partial [Dysgonamonadaceae bacterium]|nr:peptidase M75 [Dysgonamonadaceae bacterium]
KKEKLELLEMGITVSGGRYSYGQDMLNAGQAGSTKTSFADACETIIEGCITIADEVGAVKIGMPHTGEDVNYIESPYSYNSKVDFVGNIKSIQNAYLGGADATKRGASLSDYIKTVDAALDAQIREAINNAIAQIEAIPYPFAQNFTSNQAGVAMDACSDLVDVLGEAKRALSK